MKLFARHLQLKQAGASTLVLESSSLGGVLRSRATLDRGARRAWLEQWVLGLRRRWEYDLAEVDMHLAQHWSASVQGQTVLAPPTVAIYRFPRFDMTITFGRGWQRHMRLGSFHEARSLQTDFALFDRVQEFIGRSAPRRQAA